MNQSDEIINSMSIVKCQMTVDDSEFLFHLHTDEKEYKKFLKERLIKQLVQELMDKDCIEFTAQEDIIRLSKIYRARLVTIPNHIVTKLRKEGKIS